MQIGFKAALAARALLRAAGESTLAASQSGVADTGEMCQWCRSELSDGGRMGKSIDRPIGLSEKVEVARHGR